MAKLPYKTKPNGFWYAVYFTDPNIKEVTLDYLALTREEAKEYIRRHLIDNYNGRLYQRSDFKIVLEDRRNER